MSRNKARERALSTAVHWIARIIGHISIAAVGRALDYVAFKIGRFWAALAACFLVRNGRFVPALGFIADWLLARKDTTFVFSLTMLIVFVAEPYVFPDLEKPATELWYSYSRTGAVTLPVFIVASIYFHYPDDTAGVVRNAIASLIRDTPTMSEAVDWFWIALACAAAPYVLYSRVITHPLVRLTVEMIWRAAGKRVYDYKNAKEVELAAAVASLPEPPTYEHSELTQPWEIRLLQILPRGNSDQISCKLIHVLLSDSPSYEAMSYTWGDPAKTKTILIDGKPFKTTENVYNLLYDRSPIWHPRIIWIDSICINQTDNEEKAAQVNIMRFIYAIATKVTVWLGAAQGSYLAVQLILELSRYIEADQPTDEELYRRYKHERRSPRWIALGDLMRHTYFSRIWMVQEVATNQTLHVAYGKEVFQWKTLMPVFIYIFSSFSFSVMIEDSEDAGRQRTPEAASISNAIILARVRFAVQEPKSKKATLNLNLRELLTTCWTFDATDPRDKVFALVGLAEDNEDPLVRPDYNKSVEQVYLDTAKYLFSQENAVKNVLHCSGIGWPHNIKNLPSWAPDWSIVGRSVIAQFPMQESAYRTSGNLGTQNIRTRVVDNMLELNVIMVDVVKRIGQELPRPQVQPGVDFPSGLTLHRFSRFIREAREMTRDMGMDSYVTGQPLEEALWRTLCCDAPGISENDEEAALQWPAPAVFGRWYRYVLHYFLEEEEFEDASKLSRAEVDERFQQGGRWLTSTQARSYSRCFGVTDEGYMALLPALARVGDMVVVVPGSAAPFVLRPITGRSGSDLTKTFELVGECYVHGVMNGEKADARAVERVYLV